MGRDLRVRAFIADGQQEHQGGPAFTRLPFSSELSLASLATENSVTNFRQLSQGSIVRHMARSQKRQTPLAALTTTGTRIHARRHQGLRVRQCRNLDHRIVTARSSGDSREKCHFRVSQLAGKVRVRRPADTGRALARGRQKRKANMEFRVLGPIELWSAEQQRDLGPTRERSVLAILLLTPRTIVPTDTLIDRLWDTQPPAKARESLSVYITRLRASLRQALGESIRLGGRARGYEIDVDPEVVDLHRFRRLRRQADALTAGGDPEHAAQLLREADALWRGPAFAGIRSDWFSRMRDSLEEERRAAILKRVECELELGRHADLVGELTRLLDQYPLDETFMAHQMTALYLSGRPGDALSFYQEARRGLIEEQGTEPGPVLTELHQRILRHDPELAARSADKALVRMPRADTLPPETVDFVGRSKELAQLTSEPDVAPRVSIIEGMAGVGKTALAVHAARAVSEQYPDGMFYLNFHTHDPGRPSLDGAEAVHRLLRMLTAPTTQIPDGLGERTALLRAQLSRRRAIVILDDAARQDQILPLLPAAGRSLVLITTRRRLTDDLAGASALTLDVLSMDDAVMLFQSIAGRGRAYDEDQAALAVRLCGRLPLAIQLTAGRLAQDFPPRLSDLVEELSQPPVQLGGAGAASPELMSAFDLSYRSLEPDHQRFFRRLGISPCAYLSLHAAAALAGSTVAEAERAIAALLDHHLLAQAPAGQFRFHDLIREFAAVCAAREDSRADQRQAVGRLLDYYLHTAGQADEMLHPFRRRMRVPGVRQPGADLVLRAPEEATAWLEAEWRNVLQAAHYASRHEWKRKCADLIHALGGFMEVRAYWDEAIAAHTAALQASRDLDDQGRIARAALELSEVSQQTGRHEAALPLAEDAAAIYRTLADARSEAEALDQVGLTHQRAGRSREALAYFREARIMYHDAGDQHGVASTLSHAGISSFWLGRYPDAMDQLREALALYQEVGDRRGQAKTLNNLGRMQLSLGYHRDALEGYQKSLEIFSEIGGVQNEAILYHNIGAVYHYKGSYEEGIAAYRRALVMYRDIGDLPNEADVLNDMGTIYQSAECYDEALIYHEKARVIAEEIGNLSQQVIALRGVADVHRESGHYPEAFEQYDAALRLAREIGDPYEEGKILEGIAETTLSTRRPDTARIVLRQALDIFERLGVPEAESARIRIEALDPAFARRTS
jgi:DNA-binding SARP family transcriptional activator/tetratricopeptide (TPR) repeat protein